MTDDALIGIVGGYGAVGRAAASRLRDWGAGRLRIGGRNLKRAHRFVQDALGSAGEAFPVDFTDEDALTRFCEGCRIVVNCAGPSYRILDRIACAAFAAGANYVDAYGDDPVYERLIDHDLVGANRTAMLSAGVMPGLAGLLPRWLAMQGFDRTTRLQAYVGGLERVTPAAAADYLLSLGSGYGESLAGWRNGARVSKMLTPLFRAELPFFPRPVTAYPYLSTEAERVARALSLDEARWYNVFDGTEGLAALNRFQASAALIEELDSAAAELVKAAELDLFGRTRYQVLLFQLDGEANGWPLTRTAILRAADGFELSGALAALAVSAVLQADVAPGVHYAADALDPGATVDRLRESPAVGALDVVDGPAETAIEEGTL